MKIRTLLLLTILLCPTLAFAQHDGMGQGYLFGAIGKSAYTSTTAQVGAGIGFERLFGPGIGAGLDFQGYGVGGRNGSYGGDSLHCEWFLPLSRLCSKTGTVCNGWLHR